MTMAALRGDADGGEHAPGDCFAVQQLLVFRGGFDGVAQRVAEVEQHAQAGFALVGGDDFGLDADAGGDDFGQAFRVLREDGFRGGAP